MPLSEEAVAISARSFVIGQMQANVDRTTIIRKLSENMGMNSSDATELVTTVRAQLIKKAEEEEPNINSIMLAIIGGCIAAIVGGIIWGLIVLATDYEIGFMATGIGLLAGFTVAFFARGKKGIPFQVIAVITSFLGIIIGKYICFFSDAKEYVFEKYGTEGVAKLSIFSFKIIQIFLDEMGRSIDIHDLIWTFLAFIAAWRIPKGFGTKSI